MKNIGLVNIIKKTLSAGALALSLCLTSCENSETTALRERVINYGNYIANKGQKFKDMTLFKMDLLRDPFGEERIVFYRTEPNARGEGGGVIVFGGPPDYKYITQHDLSWDELRNVEVKKDEYLMFEYHNSIINQWYRSMMPIMNSIRGGVYLRYPTEKEITK